MPDNGMLPLRTMAANAELFGNGLLAPLFAEGVERSLGRACLFPLSGSSGKPCLTTNPSYSANGSLPRLGQGCQS